MAAVVLPESTRALYPFASHFLTLSDGNRIHYLDEGPPDGRVLVFLHGYPLWSFTFRALIVYYAALGYRCIAVDHVGYGLSDKPADKHYHTVRRHIINLHECLNTLDLTGITLIMEDWGGPIGLGYALRNHNRVAQLVLMNTWAFQQSFANRLHPIVSWSTQPGVGDLLFARLNLVIDWLVQRWSERTLTEAVLMAYRAPFKDARQRAALIQFPRLISTSALHPSADIMREIEARLAEFKRTPALLLWGEDDPAFPREVANHWKKRLPRAHGPHIIPDTRHFLVEDAPEEVTQHLDAFLNR